MDSVFLIKIPKWRRRAFEMSLQMFSSMEHVYPKKRHFACSYSHKLHSLSILWSQSPDLSLKLGLTFYFKSTSLLRRMMKEKSSSMNDTAAIFSSKTIIREGWCNIHTPSKKLVIPNSWNAFQNEQILEDLRMIIFAPFLELYIASCLHWILLKFWTPLYCRAM